jgi:hypothetical protein
MIMTRGGPDPTVRYPIEIPFAWTCASGDGAKRGSAAPAGDAAARVSDTAIASATRAPIFMTARLMGASASHRETFRR